MSTETRLEQVERRLDVMSSRVRELEAGAKTRQPAPASSTPQPLASTPAAAAAAGDGRRHNLEPAPARVQAASRPASGASFEELFGGRVLAWIGALAILLGAILFMGMAVGNGWIGEAERTVIAVVGLIGLLGVGLWLQEGKGQAEAARAAVAAAISGLYAVLLVATQVYELIPAELGLACGALIAGVGFGIAVRWSSPVVATVGSLGALASPILVGAGISGASIGFVALALGATVGILLWQRWDVLALAAFTVSAPQLLGWAIANDDRHLELVLATLVGFWVLYVVAAFGFELRTRARAMVPIASMLLLFGAAALVAGTGFYVLSETGHETAAAVWLFGFAAVHLALGGLAMRLGIHREIGALLLGVGIALTAVGLADSLDGPALVAAWAAESVVLAYLATRLGAEPDRLLSGAERMLLAAGAFLALAILHALAVEAPPEAIFNGLEDAGAAVGALGACAAAALAYGHFARRISPEGARAAAFAAAGLLVYLGSVLIVDRFGVDAAGESLQSGQVWLSVFWAVTGLGAVVWGLVRRSASVRLGGLALLGMAIVKVWTYDLSELEDIARVLSFVGLGLLLLVGAFAYQRIMPGQRLPEEEA